MWRVIWQYNHLAIGDMSASVAPDLSRAFNTTESAWSDLKLFGDPEPVFQEAGERLRLDILGTRSLANDPLMDLSGYAHAFMEREDDALQLVGRLQADRRIRYAQMQGQWQLPVKFGKEKSFSPLPSRNVDLQDSTPDLIQEQGYLRPSPGGIDAFFGWTKQGGKGTTVRIVDIESGWNFSHEDLLKNGDGILYGQPADNDHGTAVLGIMAGTNNAVGVTGIVPESRVAAASATYGNGKWNAAAAIKFTADRLAPGDIILLEMHAPGPNARSDPSTQQGFVPIEFWDSEFAAIKYATARGIYVVEAGGNGGEDLDHPVYRDAFNRQARDSGAILVGAGNSMLHPLPRSRISWSNFGRRVDVQGWGYDIVTTGGRQMAYYHDRVDSPTSSRCYTQSFGGTSGASPIVVGVLACMSGILRAQRRQTLPPAIIREITSRTGASQIDAPGFPKTQHIGNLPNLKDATSQL